MFLSCSNSRPPCHTRATPPTPAGEYASKRRNSTLWRLSRKEIRPLSAQPHEIATQNKTSRRPRLAPTSDVSSTRNKNPRVKGVYSDMVAIISFCIDLYCTVLYYTVLYYTTLYCTLVHYTGCYCAIQYYSYCTVLYCAVLYYVILCCTVYCTAEIYDLYCTALYCTALYCTYCTVMYNTIPIPTSLV